MNRTTGNDNNEEPTIKEEPISESESLMSSSDSKPNIIYKKRSRIQYTQQQLHILESTFQLHHYPTVDIVDNLAEGLKLQTQKISVWFQNRRSRMKKESKHAKISNIQHQELKSPAVRSPTCFSPSSSSLSPFIEQMYQNTWNNYRYPMSSSSGFSQPMYTLNQYNTMSSPSPAHYNNYSSPANYPDQPSYPFHNSTNFQYDH
ncbi:unnamed protein product [Didymodactylos carnosus]|uniref:Homeobox domain-containing protein n=1 Tax=Didymodactylos carnosus TaxID=1234261 RepID=A0A813SRY7_9BILA|nr:unnamed protein product [Didymodactylos carnosus]CAF1078578.1 unnamed protein product [Didymodactylos carnosus]CAF3583214.1 unnamed protein product [Didymodactylos carnosus]CAF3841985.1 unnamed protein product [Didymodactylos carnosus]